MPDAENALLKRSPRSRKSLAIGKSTAALSPRRKRAHSIVPGEKIKLNAPRRSILRPAKGILKSSNQTDPTQDTLQNITQFLPSSSTPSTQESIEASTSFTGDFHTNIYDTGTTRKSLGGRRVSFAAHAHVRVFETNEQRPNENTSPSASSPPNEVKSVQRADHQSPKDTETSSWQFRRTSTDSQPYFNDQDGEESMELSDDNIMPQVSTEDMSFSESMSQVSDSSADDGNMSMTGGFGEGILSQQQSLAAPSEPRRKSRMRSSISVPVSANGIEPTDFTVSVDRSPPPETDAFKALKAMANGNRPDYEEDEGEETEMDVSTAVSRLIAARNSVGGGFQMDDSFSTEDSMDLEDDRTMNMTSVMSNLQGVDMDTSVMQVDEETMSVASVVSPHILKSRISTPHRSQPSGSPSKDKTSQSRIPIPLSVPKFTKSISSGSALPALSKTIRPRKSSVAKEIPPVFNHQDVLPSQEKSNSSEKTTSATQEPLQVEVHQDSSHQTDSRARSVGEDVSRSARRPSGYYRKSLRPSSTTTLPAQTSANKDVDNEDLIEDQSPTYNQQGSQQSQTMGKTHSQGSSTNKSARHSNKPTENLPARTRISLSEDSVIEENMDPISIEQFLNMTNIRFMDDLTCPRRSVIHPSQMKRRVSHEDSMDGPPLSLYAIAMAIHIAQLETMIWISNDMQTAIEKYKAQYQQTEDDVAKDMPMLFREYFAAGDEDREPILYVLKLIKSNTISSAKANWYEWKRGWIQGLQVNALRTLENLHADKNQLVDFSARAGETLPFLRAEYETILQELETERAQISEIEQCDQEFLSELKVTIAEQSHELDLLRTELTDGKNKLDRLNETIEELKQQTEQAEKAVKITQRQLELQKTSTRSEVVRLREELQCLQAFHLWRVISIDQSSIELLYDLKYKVTVPCRSFTPLPGALQISPTVALEDDDFPLLSQLMVIFAKRHAIQSETKATLRSMIQRLSDFWTSYYQLRWQLRFIVIKYPLSCQLLPSDTTIASAQGFQVIVTLLLLKKTAKAQIRFWFNEELLSQWPNTLSMLQYTVQVVYGQLSSQSIEQAFRSRLSEAKPEENHACLVDACMEVVSQYG